MSIHITVSRFWSLGAAAAVILAVTPLPTRAQGMNNPVTGVLGRASDSALDKLSQPGAFYNDSSVRIGLPGLGGKGGGAMSSIMGMGDKLGLTGHLTHSINDAAGAAAKEAKPIFRTAIDNLSITDAPGIVSQRDGGTQYLRRSAGSQLREKVRPLIAAALNSLGAFKELDQVNSGGMGSALGLNRDGLTNTVTDQAMNGIYKYMGNEEAKLRANPMGAISGAGSLLGGFGK